MRVPQHPTNSPAAASPGAGLPRVAHAPCCHTPLACITALHAAHCTCCIAPPAAYEAHWGGTVCRAGLVGCASPGHARTPACAAAAQGVMAQCRHALRPDGLFLAAMLGGHTLQELRIACSVAQQEREGGVSPRVSPLAQVRRPGAWLARGGATAAQEGVIKQRTSGWASPQQKQQQAHSVEAALRAGAGRGQPADAGRAVHPGRGCGRGDGAVRGRRAAGDTPEVGLGHSVGQPQLIRRLGTQVRRSAPCNTRTLPPPPAPPLQAHGRVECAGQAAVRAAARCGAGHRCGIRWLVRGGGRRSTGWVPGLSACGRVLAAGAAPPLPHLGPRSSTTQPSTVPPCSHLRGNFHDGLGTAPPPAAARAVWLCHCVL
jgi:hypothetical protein